MARAPLCERLPVIFEGTVCRLNPIFLSPTQHTAGLVAVDEKKAKLIKKYKKGRAKFDKYLFEKKIVPVVLGPSFENKIPNGKFLYYMTDSHHTMRAMAELNINYPVYIRITHDYRNLTYDYFWQTMTENNLVYHKKYGEILPVDLLPDNLYRLADDPYRTLSWIIREQGCYQNLDDIAFQEFFWADFLRDKVNADDIESAMSLAISSFASNLPGYLGECKRQE